MCVICFLVVVVFGLMSILVLVGNVDQNICKILQVL